ncbi:MAG: ABC transporter permease [Mahellales bacterium]
MKDSLKVASWEIKRNLRNKSFLISIILTPVLMLVFGGLPTLLGYFETNRVHTIYVIDEIGVYEQLKAEVADNEAVLIKYQGDEEQLAKEIVGKANTSYVVLKPSVLEDKQVTLFTGAEGMPDLSAFETALDDILKNHRLVELGLDQDVIKDITADYRITMASLTGDGDNWAQRVVPAVFSGFILISVFITGTMTLQSAIQEKKDKMAEVLLSSITPGSLMQGKILGYFVLGIIQVLVWLAFAIPAAQLFFRIPVLDYLFVPELGIMLFFALVGYLMFSALFVSMGATMEDIHSAGNFQGILFIIPMLPMFFLGAIVANPNGIVARIGSYFPLTAPGVMLFRLSFLNTVPVLETVISSILLITTTIAIIRLAGKIFKVGILMYGKNATPKEILKWLKY